MRRGSVFYSWLIKTTSIIILVCAYGFALADTVRCSPWIVDGEEYGNPVSVQFGENQLIWSDGHGGTLAKEVDRTRIGRTYVASGEVYFAYPDSLAALKKPSEFQPTKVVLIRHYRSKVSPLKLICEAEE